VRTKRIGGHEFDLSESRDVIDYVTIWYPMYHFPLVVLWKKPLPLTVSEIFNGECDAMVDKGQGYSFGTNTTSYRLW